MTIGKSKEVKSEEVEQLPCRSVTHSKTNKDNWWAVDLGKVYAVNMVVLYNRQDCCQDRIDGATVSI